MQLLRPFNILFVVTLLPGLVISAESETGESLRSELASNPNRILYESYHKDNWEIFIMNADGSDKRNLTNTKEIHELYPQASFDGSKVCFLVDEISDNKTIRSVYFMNSNGTGRTLVAKAARQSCWSPDGTKIAFVKQEFSRLNIKDFASKGLFIYDLKTGKTTGVPNKKIHHLYNLTWSADGKWIVSTVHGGMGFGHANIAIELGGHRVVDLKLKGCRPTLSPNGKMITWSSNDHTINVADIDFSGVVPKVSKIQIVDQRKKLHLYHPDFSPDGKYISYSVGPGGRMPVNGPGTHREVGEMVGVRGIWDIYLRPADGKGPIIQLTDDKANSPKESEWLPTPKSKTKK